MIDTTEKRQAELVMERFLLGKEILNISYLDPEVNEFYINQDYSLKWIQ